MTVDIEKLEALARACGDLNWRAIQENWTEWAIRDDHAYIATMRTKSAKQPGPCSDRESKAKFLCAVTPAAVLELIAELKSAKAENENLKSNTAGFAAAFYQVADAVGVTGARAATPEKVFTDEVMPAIRELRKDAERYRWLRDEASPADVEFFSHQSSYGFETEVDAAMSKQANQ